MGMRARPSLQKTRSSAIAEEPHDALDSRNLATMNDPISKRL